MFKLFQHYEAEDTADFQEEEFVLIDGELVKQEEPHDGDTEERDKQ